MAARSSNGKDSACTCGQQIAPSSRNGAVRPFGALGIQVVGEADDQRQLPEIVGRAARFSCDRDGEESPSENMRHVP